MTRERCPLAGLETALSRDAARTGAVLAIEAHRARAWHSATFSGHRHVIEASAPETPGLHRWLAGLESLDPPLPGERLAELRVERHERAEGVSRLRLSGVTVATG